MGKLKNNIPYFLTPGVGTTKMKENTVLAEDMYILYKQYL